MQLRLTFTRESEAHFYTGPNGNDIHICKYPTQIMLGMLTLPFTLELNDEENGQEFTIDMTGEFPKWKASREIDCIKCFLFRMDKFLEDNLDKEKVHDLYLRVVPNE